MKKKTTGRLKAVIVISVMLFMFVQTAFSQDDFIILKEVIELNHRFNKGDKIILNKRVLMGDIEKYINMNYLKKSCGFGYLDYPIDTLFIRDDVDCMLNQLGFLERRKWHKKDFNGPIVKLENARSFYKERNEEETLSYEYYSFSRPIYSCSGQSSIVFVYKFCGMECGSGTAYVLLKKDGEWKIVCNIGLWIS